MSLRVWLPLDGDLRNLGCSNASLTNTNAAVNNSGKIGSCYSFGTSNSYLKFNDINFMHSFTECSVSLWLKILSWNTSYATYFQLGLGSTPWAHYIFGLLRNSSASTLCFTISNGSSATNANCLTPALELNTWYHLTLTYANGHCKIYVNGVETKDYSTTIVPNFSGITTGTIGAANNLTGYQTNCLINDFRVYDHCLSAAEVHEIAQGLVLHYKLDDNMHGIKDSSGYNHNAVSNGSQSIILDSDSPKYSYSSKFRSGARIAMPIASSACLPTDAITVSIWYKSSAGTTRFLSCTESGGWNFEVNSSKASFPFYIKGKGYGRVTATKNFYSDNQWHMITASYDGIKTAKIYLDGELDNTSTTASGWENLPIAYNSSTPLTLGAEAQTIASPIAGTYVGNLSDLRIYCTALDADDVLTLYHTGAKIDNKSNFHTFEINEFGTNKLTKSGIMYNNMIESIKILPDNSCWQLVLFHYVDGGKNLFTSTNATNCNDFGLFSRLKDINNFTYNGKYEFYVIQDDIEYRWTQNNQPTASSISGLTVVSGYANPVNGLAKASQSNTYIGYNSWWGACGCYKSFSTGGKTGIPGFGPHDANGVCTYYLALYARIPDISVKLSNQTANSFEFIEL